VRYYGVEVIERTLISANGIVTAQPPSTWLLVEEMVDDISELSAPGPTTR
jgi:hypothetical protein